MARPRTLPPNSVLLDYLKDGMTHQEIADLVSKQTGKPVSRGAVSIALWRAGAPKTRVRYSDEVPWSVRPHHTNEYPIRMLRLYARRRHEGQDKVKPLTKDEEQRLNSWLTWLQDNDAVVAYVPDREPGRPGLIYVEAGEVSDRPHGIPVRERPIDISELGGGSSKLKCSIDAPTHTGDVRKWVLLENGDPGVSFEVRLCEKHMSNRFSSAVAAAEPTDRMTEWASLTITPLKKTKKTRALQKK